MPPSGFVRSTVINIEVGTRPVLIGSVPPEIRPFVFDIEIRSANDRQATTERMPVRTALPSRLTELIDGNGSNGSLSLCLLINNLAYRVEPGRSDSGLCRVATLPIPQDGGDFYLLRGGGAGAPVARVQGVWRVWGDATGGPYGQKPLFDTQTASQSSTAEGYEVDGRDPDLVLSDQELEQVHLLGFS